MLGFFICHVTHSDLPDSLKVNAITTQRGSAVLHSKTDHEELIEKSVHLLYEIRQFEDKCRRLAQFAGSNNVEEYIVHSVFESFLIHTRIIYEFLF